MFPVVFYAVVIIFSAVSTTVLVYLCAGAWKLYARMKGIEARLVEVDIKLIALVATLDRHLALRSTILPPPPR